MVHFRVITVCIKATIVPMSRTPCTTIGASSSLPSRLSTFTSAQFCDHFLPSQEAPLPPQGGPHNNHGGGRRMG
jgi:hypothetical protein